MHPLRPRALTREQAARRMLVWVVVGVIHAIFLSIFLFSEQLPFIFRKPGAETIILLPRAAGLSDDRNQPDRVQPFPFNGIPQVIPAPITIPLPPPVIQTQPQAATQGDVLDAIGQELGCAANSFEHLTATERLRCRRIPWHGVKLPNGTIVLDAPRPNLQFAPPQPERMSGADARRQELNRAPDCPIILNLPCMNNFMHRDN